VEEELEMFFSFSSLVTLSAKLFINIECATGEELLRNASIPNCLPLRLIEVTPKNAAN